MPGAAPCASHPYVGRSLEVAYFGGGTGAVTLQGGPSGFCPKMTPGCTWFETVCQGLLVEEGDVLVTESADAGAVPCGDAYTLSTWVKE